VSTNLRRLEQTNGRCKQKDPQKEGYALGPDPRTQMRPANCSCAIAQPGLSVFAARGTLFHQQSRKSPEEEGKGSLKRGFSTIRIEDDVTDRCSESGGVGRATRTGIFR